jgi:hypothetical protein
MQGSTTAYCERGLISVGILPTWQESSRLNIRGDVDYSFHRHNLASLSHRVLFRGARWVAFKRQDSCVTLYTPGRDL